MIRSARQTVLDTRHRSFDVICAGDALLNVAKGDASSAPVPSLRFRPGGGAINTALALAKQGLRVGLATVLPDDRSGRNLLAKVAASGIDVGGVDLAQP